MIITKQTRKAHAPLKQCRAEGRAIRRHNQPRALRQLKRLAAEGVVLPGVTG